MKYSTILNLEEEKDLEVMDDLEKQKWKKKLRKEIRKPAKTGRKIAVSAGCLGIAAGLFFIMSDSEVMAKARKGCGGQLSEHCYLDYRDA